MNFKIIFLTSCILLIGQNILASGYEEVEPVIYSRQFVEDYDVLKKLAEEIPGPSSTSKPISTKQKKIIEAELNRFLSLSFSELQEFDRDRRISYLVNLYNLYALNAVSQGSGKNESYEIEAFGAKYSPNEFIQKYFITKNKEPRTIFLLNKFSGDNDKKWIFITSEEIQSELEMATRKYINSEANVKFDVAKKTLWVSSFLKKHSSTLWSKYLNIEDLILKHLDKDSDYKRKIDLLRFGKVSIKVIEQK